MMKTLLGVGQIKFDLSRTFLAIGVAVMSSPVQAATWINPGVGDWHVVTNWDTSLVPGPSDAVIINNGTAVLTNAATNILSLEMGDDSGTSTLIVGADLNIANNIVGVGSLTYLVTNDYVQTNGDVVVDGSTTSYSYPGGKYTISGGTFTLNNNRRFDHRGGTLEISGDAVVELSGGTASQPRFGVLVGQTGYGIQSGGTLRCGGSFFIGVQGVGFYEMSGGTIWASNNFTLGNSTTGPGEGTLTQSGGTIVVGSDIGGSTFIGQNGPGVYTLSGGEFVSSGMAIGIGGGANGNLNQTGGEIDLLTGPAGPGSLSIGASGIGTYSIANGILNGVNLIMTNGTLTVKSNSTINFTGAVILDAAATINFEFSETGVSAMTVGSNGVISASATINVDGSAYTGGPAIFTLIDAASFDAEPVINLSGFALGATSNWDMANGDFTVTVGQLPPDVDFTFGGGMLDLSWPADYLGWYAQSNSVSLLDTNAWFDISGSDLVTNLSFSIDPALTNVFFRLREP